MFRRRFLSIIPAATLFGLNFPKSLSATPAIKPKLNSEDRKYWIEVMSKIADPVLQNLSKGELKKTMPVEVNPTSKLDRTQVTYLEAFGRLMAGISPWLELGADNTEEGKIRARYIQLAQKSLANAVDPSPPDFMKFSGQKYEQALVDAAFLAQALLRAPTQLWEPLDIKTKTNVIKALKATRSIKPSYNNWLLFMGMIEAFLLQIDEEYDMVRLDYAVKKHDEWYKGDGIYGDGPVFHWDYYNGYVIQPMLLEIVQVMKSKGKIAAEFYETVLNRAIRYAVIQERLISPEGTFPPIGRSLAYRFGALQGLAIISLMKKLPAEIKPAQVRGALSAVVSKMIEAPGTFDKKGWLTLGFCGHQPDIAESYISTGSLYLCTVGMLPLGLPADDKFWTDSPADWTSKKVFSGVNLATDHAIHY